MNANFLGARVRRTRMAAGLQGKDLAVALGISRPYLTQIEKGLRQPAQELLIKLAAELKTTPQWLLHGAHPVAEHVVVNMDSEARIADLERQLAVAQDTINNLSKALAQGRTNASPASGACGGAKHAEPGNRERKVGA